MKNPILHYQRWKMDYWQIFVKKRIKNNAGRAKGVYDACD